MSVLSWLRDRMYQDLPNEMQRKMLERVRLERWHKRSLIETNYSWGTLVGFISVYPEESSQSNYVNV